VRSLSTEELLSSSPSPLLSLSPTAKEASADGDDDDDDDGATAGADQCAALAPPTGCSKPANRRARSGEGHTDEREENLQLDLY
jgi:hypothetical protein